MQHLLRCVNLRVGYRKPILPPIRASIGRAEFWAIIGRNGSGKTTWFRTLLGLLPPLGGHVERLDQSLRISYVPQRSQFDPLFPLLSRDIVRMGIDRGWSFAVPRFKKDALVHQALEELDALALASQPFRDLSEGQKQRILLARLAASQPDLALLDEPTAAMDVVAERESFQYLDKLRQDHNTTIIVVTHYLSVAREFADHALFLDRESQTAVVGEPSEVLGHEAYRRSFNEFDEAANG